MIKLIINADDFGMNYVFNEKILYLLERGFIKSTTVMVNQITKEQNSQIKRLIELAKSKQVSVGLHVEIGINNLIAMQIDEQYKTFKKIFGFEPSHLDIHKKDTPNIIKEVNRFAEEHDLPVRNHSIKANTKQTTYPACRINEVTALLQKVKDDESFEVITHPGDYDPNSKSSLNRERKQDYEDIIKLNNFLKAHKNIKLISYNEL